jgi:hypothetical protein
VPLVEPEALLDVPAPEAAVPVPLVPEVLARSSLRLHAVADNASAMPTANQIFLPMLNPLCR